MKPTSNVRCKECSAMMFFCEEQSSGEIPIFTCKNESCVNNDFYMSVDECDWKHATVYRTNAQTGGVL